MAIPERFIQGLIRLPDMELSRIERFAYALDGGSIYLEFTCVDGTRHGLELVQDRLPITVPCSRKRNGDILLDGRNIYWNRAALRELHEALGAFIAHDTRTPGQMELPRNTTFLDDDLKELASKDEVGVEQLLLTWARERITRQLGR